MKDPTYNGWTNYETWCMALWIDNAEGSYRFSRAMAREVRDSNATVSADFPMKRTDVGILADHLKEWVERGMGGGMPELPASVWSDLLSAAFQEIDWYEIAESILEENYLEEVADAD